MIKMNKKWILEEDLIDIEAKKRWRRRGFNRSSRSE